MITFCKNLLMQTLTFLTKKHGASGWKGESGQGSAIHTGSYACIPIIFQLLKGLLVVRQTQNRHPEA